MMAEIFEENSECPHSDDMIEGVPKNTFWEYVNSGYLDGFINLIKIEKAWMITRYEESGHADEIVKIEEMAHAKLCRHDDVIVVGTTRDGTQSWLFWFDRDSSDCCIGRSDAPVEAMIDEARKITSGFLPHYEIDKALGGLRGWKSW